MGEVIRSPSIEEEILERLSKGEPLATFCRELEHMPSARQVHRWVAADPDFAKRYDEARLVGFDLIAEDCLKIADDTHNDTIVDEETGKERPNTEWIARSRLKVETRLKMLSKWYPQKYGDKIQHTGSDGESPIQTRLTINFVKAGEQKLIEGEWKEEEGGGE